jgi:hypothetical protein
LVELQLVTTASGTLQKGDSVLSVDVQSMLERCDGELQYGVAALGFQAHGALQAAAVLRSLQVASWVAELMTALQVHTAWLNTLECK